MPNWRALGRLTSSGLFSTFSLGGWLVVGTGRTSASRRRRELRREVEAKPKPSLRGRKILIPRRIEVFASQPAFGERTSAGAGSIKGIPTRHGKGGRNRDRQIGTSSHRALDSRTTLHAPQSRSQIPPKAHKCSCQTPSGVREDGCREHREDRKPSKIGGPYRFLLRAGFSTPRPGIGSSTIGAKLHGRPAGKGRRENRAIADVIHLPGNQFAIAGD